MFVKLQLNKFFNLNEIRSVEVVAFDSLPTDLNRSYIAIYYVERHSDAEVNDTLYYGNDCKHDNDQFKKDVEALHKATHTKMITDK